MNGCGEGQGLDPKRPYVIAKRYRRVAMNNPWKSMFVRFGFVLLGTALLVFPATAGAVAKIDIRYLSQGKKVIPVSCRIGNWEITDIKLPELVVTNNRKAPLTVDRVEVIGTVSGVKTVRMQISGKPLREAIKKTASWINDPNTQLFSVKLSFGNVVLPSGVLSGNATAGEGESVLLPLSKIAYLHHVGQTKLDGMEIRLIMRSGGTKTIASFPVQLTLYQVKGAYLFPVKGDLRMAYTPLSYIHHRASASQEFGIDIIGANQKDAASFTDISRPNPKKLTDYSIWGRQVLAAGSGVVVETGVRFPEDRMSNPAVFNQPGYVQNLLMELIPEIGVTNALFGNYVIINHRNGEYAAYCHLQEGSIRVKPGDKVEKGEVVASVGNTGNSGAPHLHFQLMDSRDFFAANGLPMMFEDVSPNVIISEYPVTANTLSFSDSIFTAVP
jgi:hypothetical protein